MAPPALRLPLAARPLPARAIVPTFPNFVGTGPSHLRVVPEAPPVTYRGTPAWLYASSQLPAWPLPCPASHCFAQLCLPPL